MPTPKKTSGLATQLAVIACSLVFFAFCLHYIVFIL